MKDIENRSRRTRYRGLVLIHASKGVRDNEVSAWRNFIEHRNLPLQSWAGDYPMYEDIPNGGIIGVVDIVDCVTESDSPWFVGPYGYVLRNPKPLPFTPCKGMLGFFKPVLESSK